jgi:hypothetical protein
VTDLLERERCRIGGANQNYSSNSGTTYHIQIEDFGPTLDRVTEKWIRRLNMIIYANYGETNARIIYSHDYDFEDNRTQAHNELIQGKVGELIAIARDIIEDKEQRQIGRIKGLIRQYHEQKDEKGKKEIESANNAFPFLFSQAWLELRQQKAERIAQGMEAAEAAAPTPDFAPLPEEVVYPLDSEMRERILEIERISIDISNGLKELKARGKVDDILLQTCRKLMARARETLEGREASEFTTRRLDMTQQSLLTTLKQIQSRLR